MKTACLLLLTMSWVALTHEMGYAVPMSPASLQTSPASSVNTASGHPGDGERAAPAADGKYPKQGKTSHEQRGHDRLSDMNHPPSRASLTRVNRSQELPKSGQRSLPGNSMNLHQPGSDKSSGVANSGLIRNETVNNALAVRTSNVVRSTSPSFNNVRHRSPNSAVVGGPANSHSSNIGTINGTLISGRP